MVRYFDGIDVSGVQMYDCNVVLLLSSLTGETSVSTVQRFDQSKMPGCQLITLCILQ
uniref:Uncharacterized protein n=1 Tax=Lepeophtheirus salmonis TaxID=72036 RepID=A0A0K2VGC1_LEPSM